MLNFNQFAGTAAEATAAIARVKDASAKTNAFVQAAAPTATAAAQAFAGADAPWYKSPWLWGGLLVVASVGGYALIRRRRRYGSFGDVNRDRSEVRSPTSTSTEVRSPTSTSTEVRSPTSTSTEVRSPTSTSTDAYTAGNITVTGGAGDGATTSVTVYRNGCGIDPVSKAGKAKARERQQMADHYRKSLSPTGASQRERQQMALHSRTGKSKTGASQRERQQMARHKRTGRGKATTRKSATSR